MKCDDDTFIRIDSVLKEIKGISPEKSLYMGNLNLLHRPLRSGKWAVTYEVFKFVLTYTGFVTVSLMKFISFLVFVSACSGKIDITIFVVLKHNILSNL